MPEHKPIPPPETSHPPSLEDSLLTEYGASLEDKGITDAQKKEFLLNLWKIMTVFVDLGLDLGPAPAKDGDKSAQISEGLTHDVLHSLNLKDTAHETVAPLSNPQEEEQT